MKNFLIVLAIVFAVSCSQDDQSRINLVESEKFLAANLLNEGVIEIEPGLQYQILKSTEDGKQPESESVIMADFHGTLIDGNVFWSSIEIGEPLTITLSQLIPGCQKAISKMREGDSWTHDARPRASGCHAVRRAPSSPRRALCSTPRT